MAIENNRYIRIQGEAVCAVEEVVHNRTTLPEWLAAIRKLEPTTLTTPVLPEGCALFAQKGTEQLVIINQPAGVKKVIWRTAGYRDMEQRAKTRWQLAVPPHVFLLVFRGEALKSSHLYFVPVPITSEKDTVYRTGLANIYGRNEGEIPTAICTGSIRLDVKASLASRCQQFITSFWETEFNDDIHADINPRSQYYIFSKDTPKQFVNLNAWEKATTDEPDFLTKMDWPFKPLCTVSQILNERWKV